MEQFYLLEIQLFKDLLKLADGSFAFWVVTKVTSGTQLIVDTIF